MRCKWILPIAAGVMLLIWVVGYLWINNRVKQPMKTVYREGDTFLYYGMEITVGKKEVYSAHEFCKISPVRLQADRDLEHGIVLVINFHIRNTSGYDIHLKEGLQNWQAETGDYYYNGQMYELLMASEYPYKKDSEMDFQMFFFFIDGQNFSGGIESFRESEVRVYMSYYPESRYIQY